MDLNSDSTKGLLRDCRQGALLGPLFHHYLLDGVRINLGDFSKNGIVGRPRVHPFPKTFLKPGKNCQKRPYQNAEDS